MRSANLNFISIYKVCFRFVSIFVEKMTFCFEMFRIVRFFAWKLKSSV